MKQIYFVLPYRHPDFIIDTDEDDLGSRLHLYYNCSFPKKPSEHAVKLRVEKVPGGFDVSGNGRVLSVVDPLPAIQELVRENSRIIGGLIGLHAACVEANEYAFAFTAPTSTGKTTLAAYLAYHGCGYISDDCAMIEPKARRVKSCGNPVHLRGGGLEVLRAEGIFPETVFVGDRHVYMPENHVEDELPLRGVFIIERSDTENRVEALTQSETVRILMQSVISGQRLTVEYLKALAGLAGTGAKKICYKDMGYVLHMVRNEASR